MHASRLIGVLAARKFLVARFLRVVCGTMPASRQIVGHVLCRQEPWMTWRVGWMQRSPLIGVVQSPSLMQIGRKSTPRRTPIVPVQQLIGTKK